MKTVYKYQLDPHEPNGKVSMAGLLRVVHVAPATVTNPFNYDIETKQQIVKDERINIWCEVDTAIYTFVPVYIIGTGNPINGPDWVHCGTAVMPSGLVWHVYIPQICFRIEVR